MTRVIDLEEGRLQRAAKRGYRNWISQFNEEFGLETRLSHVSFSTLAYLAQGKEKGSFYLYDLIMNLQGLGSGFEFNELHSKEKMLVIDKYLFLLDRIRFEVMKRLGWLESYPGEELSLVELIVQFEKMAPSLQAKVPVLSRDHPDHEQYMRLNTFDREAFVRKLIPKALKKLKDYSVTL